MSFAYCCNNDQLLQEVIDDEVIMFDLENRIYYTMNKSGSLIWLLLQQGCGLAMIANLVAAQCNAASQTISEQVKAFVNRLLAERLIVEQDGAVAKASTVPAGMLSPMSGFLEPVLSKFTDMLYDTTTLLTP